MLKRIWKRARTARGASRAHATRMSPRWDALESREMLSATPTDYVLSGDSWANPGHITYSFPADGTPWDGGLNNLSTALDAEYPTNTAWVRQIAKALQTWASVANINVVPTTDGTAPFNDMGLSQGDPRFGDIRIGGYNFDSSTVLAQSYNPPPNGLTGAGDVEVNTGFNWGPGASYDLYSVLLHETGLALGMAETSDPTAVMNRVYGGVRAGLEPVDIAGIQAIYGPRTPDPLQSLGEATSAASAFDLTAGLAPSGPGQAVANVRGVSLDAIGDTEYYAVTAPAGSTAETLVATASSQGISSLSPKVTIYDASMHPLATAGNPAFWGDGMIATASGIVPGGKYIVAVTGATNDVFSVGSYAFQVIFKGIGSPTAPVPPTPVPPPPAVPPPAVPPTTSPGQPSPTTAPPKWPPPTVPAPPVQSDRFEPDNDAAHAVDLGPLAATVVTGLTLDSPTDSDVFTFVASKAGTVVVATGSTRLSVVNASAQTVAQGTGQVSFTNATAGSRYWIILASADGKVDPGYALAIAVTPSASTSQQTVAATRTNPGWSIPAPTPAPPTSSRAASPAVSPLVAGPGRPLQRVPVVNPLWARPV